MMSEFKTEKVDEQGDELGFRGIEIVQEIDVVGLSFAIGDDCTSVDRHMMECSQNEEVDNDASGAHLDFNNYRLLIDRCVG